MPRPNVSKQRRRQILDAAVQIFSQQGFDAARVEDIADAAKISKGTVYLYFKSKDALIEGAMRRVFEPLAELSQSLPVEGGAGAALTAYLELVLDAFEQMQSVYPLLFEYFALASRQGSASGLLEDYFAAYRDVLAGQIRAGIQAGIFKPVDADETALTFISLLEGILLLSVATPGLVGLRAQGSVGIYWLLNALQV